MTYSLKFHEKALKEWKKLGEPIKSQFKKKLYERLSGFSSALYKIKLRAAGYRLVYEVSDNEITVFVLSVGKCDRLQAYENARNRTH